MLITFDFVTIDYENEIRKMITKKNKAKNKLRLKKKENNNNNINNNKKIKKSYNNHIPTRPGN